MGRDVHVVLKGRGGAMRLENGEVRVVRGRLTWRIPLRALGAVESDGATSVRLRISGDTSGDGFQVSSGNSNAVGAFTEALRRAMRGHTPVSDGVALVSTEPTPRTPLALSTRAAKWTVGVGGYLLLLIVLFTVVDAPDQLGWLTATALLLPGGAALLVLAWKFFLRDPWILRRRGVTVPGEIVDYRTTPKQQAMHPVLRFTTAGGVTVTQESTVTVLMRRGNSVVDVTYDPQNPSRVRGGRAVAHMTAGLFVAVLGSIATFLPLTGFVLSVLDGFLNG
ncbi:DUF3592 domain-containing protein [Streptomyces sp. NPDC126514]|uniref:DUF3592 domain-containing protein n=1 Tax=Streptomyces sp. NPDC126514 TaxID=3155210 RepID=UPI003319F14C